MNTAQIAQVELKSEAERWSWLANHHTGPTVWLITWKTAHRDKYPSRDQVLGALAAYGWVDGRRKKLDADQAMQLIARRQQTKWVRTYKERAERLITEDRMQPPGLCAIEQARVNGQWEVSDPVDDLEVPPDLREALDLRQASEWFDDAAPSYRRNVLRFMATAICEETRAKWIMIIADYAAYGEKVPQY